MKLLFICEKIDLPLKFRLDQLTSAGIEADCLVLPKFTLYKNWEKELLEPSSKLGFLEKNNALQLISQHLKYRQLFKSLEKYDSVNIYKATTICAPHINEIKNIARSYFVTVDDEKLQQNKKIDKVLQDAYCLLFKGQTELEEFEKVFGYDEKTLLARNGNYFFEMIDNLEQQEIEKFQKYLSLNQESHLVYCDLGSDTQIQKDFVESIAALPKELLKRVTFIFDPAASSLIDKEILIENLQDKEFNYLLPDSLLTDRQKSILFKISDSSIFLPGGGDYSTLQPSLYVKNHLFRFGSDIVNPKYKKLDIFIDTYLNFENSLTANKESQQIVKELTEKNHDVINTMYHPKICQEQYLKILEIL